MTAVEEVEKLLSRWQSEYDLLHRKRCMETYADMRRFLELKGEMACRVVHDLTALLSRLKEQEQ